MMRRAILAISSALVLGLATVVASTVADDPPSRSDAVADTARGANEEAEEQAEKTELRLEALAEAEAEGRVGKMGRLNSAPAGGWAGERLLDPVGDDWEPAIAADPNGPNVYALVTRYGVTIPGCQGKCPDPAIVLERSTDNGATWTDGQFLCGCKGSQGQFDPIIEVVPGTGHVYAVWMNDFNVVFSSSTNHGVSWSTPVKTYGNVSWTDKPVLAVSDDGQHVYIAWNGPTNGDAWISQSHDGGSTWTQTKVIDGARYNFAFDGDVMPNGTVVFTNASISYTGPGAAAVGLVEHGVLRSTNQGASWTLVPIDAVELGLPCESEICYADFYAGHAAISAGANSNLVFVYDGATTPGGQQRIWSRRSTDGGATWSGRTMLSSGSEHATAPMMESAGTGSVRVAYYETNGGRVNRWNVWYRTSSDAGQTWSAPVKLSDATSGTVYKTPEGFKEVYGDYGEMAIMSTGKTIAIWGEGESYLGPGGSWYNRET
jgi:hypothetical protein